MFKKLIIVAILLVVIAIGLFLFRSPSRNQANKYNFVLIKKTSIIQGVNVTGKVKSPRAFDLAFEAGGKVSKIRAQTGDRVKSGQILIELDASEIQNKVNKAKAELENNQAILLEYKAALAKEKIKLDEIKGGNRTEEIQIKKAELAKAEQDLQGFYNTILGTLLDAYTKADDAVRTKTSSIFKGSKSTSYTLTFNSCDYKTEVDAENLRLASEENLEKWYLTINDLQNNATAEALSLSLREAQEYLKDFKAFLEKTYATLTTGCTLNDVALDAYRSNIYAGRTNVINALNNVTNLINTINSQKLTIAKIGEELNLKLAGYLNTQIKAQEAQVQQSQANVIAQEARVRQVETELYDSQLKLAKTRLASPIDGLITRLDIQEGELINAYVPVVSMLAENAFELEAYVPEADITNIKVGNEATLTFDAYEENNIFQAMVTHIDPAETIIEGVTTYKIILKLNNGYGYGLIKSGMTANIDIITAKKENVFAVPQGAIITKNGQKLIRLLMPDGTIQEREVTIGIKGLDGNIEIQNGLNENDKVIID